MSIDRKQQKLFPYEIDEQKQHGRLILKQHYIKFHKQKIHIFEFI